MAQAPIALPKVDQSLIDALNRHIAGQDLTTLVAVTLLFEDQEPILYVAANRSGTEAPDVYSTPTQAQKVDIVRYDSVAQILYRPAGDTTAAIAGWMVVNGRHKKVL